MMKWAGKAWVLAWCFLGSTMGQAEADNATENTLGTSRNQLEKGLKKIWKLQRQEQGKLMGFLTQLLLSPKLSALPAAKPLPISKPFYCTRSQWLPWPHGSAGFQDVLGTILTAAVGMRMAPISALTWSNSWLS